MAQETSLLVFAAIGLAAGVLSGFLGIGGGILIVPALIYLAGFSQLEATGTSLAILLPPVGLAAVLEYYHAGNVNIRAAAAIAICLFFGAWLASHFANRVNGAYLRIGFGIFMAVVGIYMIVSTMKEMGRG
jgi:hypothetical protein